MVVSISALSDRGLLPLIRSTMWPCASSFNIRSFGSWIASKSPWPAWCSRKKFQYPLFRIVDCFTRLNAPGRAFGASFNIRSFGSWIASLLIEILTCHRSNVSISALSDRGLLHRDQLLSLAGARFNIRSFGSWIASTKGAVDELQGGLFQYPLFRIVDCFIVIGCAFVISCGVSISALSDRGLLRGSRHPGATVPVWFQYPLFRIVDCFARVKSLSSK